MPNDERPATKADITDLRGAINGLQGEIAGMKGEITGLHAGIDDLRDEMRRDFATKAEVTAFRGEFDAFREETAAGFKAVRGDFARAMDSFRSDVDSKFGQLAILLTRTRSDVLAACERALTNSQKVDHDQLFTRDRLDKLENRVTALESRRKRRPS